LKKIRKVTALKQGEANAVKLAVAGLLRLVAYDLGAKPTRRTQ
jgi:hypothetical protein